MFKSTIPMIDAEYHIDDVIGKGSFGVVLSARKKGTSLNRRYAIKVLNERLFDDAEIKKEIRLLEILNGHKNIVRFHMDMTMFDSLRKRCYIVYDCMDYNLFTYHKLYIDKGFRIHPASVKRIMYNILQGLKHMHDNHVWHLDLKPGNILISHDGKDVKICDLGMSRISQSPILTTELLVTINYRAPELIFEGGQYFDETVDVWSVGCIFAELVLGNLYLFRLDREDPVKLWKSICLLIGNPDKTFIGRFTDTAAFRALPFVKHPVIETYKEMFDVHGFDLLKKMLCYSNRISAADALRHAYFDDYAGSVL